MNISKLVQPCVRYICRVFSRDCGDCQDDDSSPPGAGYVPVAGLGHRTAAGLQHPHPLPHRPLHRPGKWSNYVSRESGPTWRVGRFIAGVKTPG